MPKYTCEKCNTVFTKKLDYNKHIKECNTELVEPVIMANTVELNIKGRLKQVLLSCLNILRDSEGITGEKALKNLTYLLVLKLIEPKIGNEIDIDEYHYHYYNVMSSEKIEQLKPLLLKWSRFTNIVDEPIDNIDNAFNLLCKFILSNHNITNHIFIKQESFDIKSSNTYKRLCNKLQEIDLSLYDNDVLGDVYEEIMSDMVTGKVLGQHFTPKLLKDIMIDLIQPILPADPNEYESMCDPSMGTGGFLIKYIECLKSKGKHIDWSKLNEKIYGKEIEPTTFSLAVANLLISTGHIFNYIEHGDSIRVPIIRKFDIVMANPPFGIKGLKYNEIQLANKDNYIPIKSDNAICLFLQAIINMLNMNGRCAIVLPNGQEMFSKTNKTLITIREYLLKTCELKEIIHMPGSIFEFTSIKTCIFYFIKRKEGNEVLTINRQKNTYRFVPEHITANISFYEYDITNKTKNLIIEVPIEKLEENSYSLNYSEYMKEEIREQYDDQIVVKTIGEIFNCKMGKFNSNDMDNEGIFPFYSCKSNNPSGFHSSYSFDYNEYLLLVCAGGSQNNLIGDNVGMGKSYYVNGKVACMSNVCSLVSKSDIYNIKYINYYLNMNRLETNKKAHFTTNLGRISLDDIKSIKIPIPSLERQNEIVQYLDFMEKKNKTCLERISELKLSNQYCLEHQQKYGKNDVKSLGEVCDMSCKGNTNSSNITNTGEYPFYKASVTNPSGTHSSYCFDDVEYLLFIKSGGNSSNPLSLSHGIGKVYLVNGKSCANTEVVKLKNNDNILLKYLYYYLHNEQLNIQKLAKYSTNLGHIDMNKFKEFNIPIPSLERQTEIVDYCEKNDLIIQQLEQEIEDNKQLAKQYMNDIVKSED